MILIEVTILFLCKLCENQTMGPDDGRNANIDRPLRTSNKVPVSARRASTIRKLHHYNQLGMTINYFYSIIEF